MRRGHINSEGTVHGLDEEAAPREFDEVAPHQPGDRLVVDPQNPRRAIVAAPPEPTYAERRAAEYPSAEALTVALWELVYEKRPEAADALQAQREAVKAKWPKPDVDPDGK